MREAIKIYRDTFKLNLKLGFKEDIAITVKDLELWKTILTEWKAKKWSPFSVKWMLSEYERRSTNERAEKRTIPANQQPCQRRGNEDGMQARIPQRFNRGVSDLRQRAGVHLRRDSETLEEIITRALRTQN